MLGTQMLPGRKAGEHFGATPLPPVTTVVERVRNAFLRQPPPKQASDLGCTNRAVTLTPLVLTRLRLVPLAFFRGYR